MDRLNIPTNSIDVPPIERLQRAFEICGVTPEYVAKKIAGMMEAKKAVIQKGKIKMVPNDPIIIKAIEMWGKWFVEPERATNHLHLHGAKIDGLLNKARGNQTQSEE